MFCVLTKTQQETNEVMILLADHNVCTMKEGYRMHPGGHLIVVQANKYLAKHIRERELRDAEMVFQVTYNQVGFKCPICKRDRKLLQEDTCGHLTFLGKIYM